MHDTVLTPASSVAGTPIVTDSSESYSVAAPDAPDTLSSFTLSSDPDPGYGSQLTREENNTINTAASTEEFTTENYNLVTYRAAYSYDQTWTREVIVNGQPDATPPAGHLTETRTVNVGEVIDETSYNLSKTVPNPDYEAPTGYNFSNSIEVDLGDVAIAGGAVIIYDASGTQVGDAIASGLFSKKFSFVFSGAGTYYIQYYADSVAIATNDPTTVEILIDADGNVSIQ